MFEAISRVNPYTAWVAMLALFGIVGYGESRFAPKRPEIACLSWLWTLLIFCAGLFEAQFLRPFGPVLAIATLIWGGILLLRYYQAKTKARMK